LLNLVTFYFTVDILTTDTLWPAGHLPAGMANERSPAATVSDNGQLPQIRRAVSRGVTWWVYSNHSNGYRIYDVAYFISKETRRRAV